ncbi:MAG: hypothetical protein AAGJ70_00190 [Pseudomonadota bacterium]
MARAAVFSPSGRRKQYNDASAPSEIAPAWRQRPQRRGSMAISHMSWAVGGFVLGMVCWQLVGFWSFIDRVLDERAPSVSYVSASSPKEIGRLDEHGEACVAQKADVGAGTTDVMRCPFPILALQDTGGQATPQAIKAVAQP